MIVSICCITYNHEPYIRQCLDGFLMQKTDFEYEILIHDDASTDKTADIIREYEARYPGVIKPIYQTENQYSKGVRPINKFNWNRAKGKYIAMCEGDDYWTDPLKLQKQVEFLEVNENYGLVHTNYNIYHESEDKYVEHIPYRITRDNENVYYYKTGDIRTCTVLFRSEFIEHYYQLSVQPFMKNPVIGDRPLFTMIASKSKIHFINEVTSVYHITATNSASHFDDLYKYYDYLLKVNILNQELFNYLELDLNENELLANRKFYNIVLDSKESFIKSTIQLLFSGLQLKYFKEYKTVLINKFKSKS